jgi:hypothetical protein
MVKLIVKLMVKGKAFARSDSLGKHMLTHSHSGEKPHVRAVPIS